MTSLVEKALGAKRESKSVDFKQGFDCDSKGDWCEVIKDLVAMANSGGGIVVFGLGNTGESVGFDCTRLAALDPADVANKIGPYIGSSNFAFSIVDLQKGSCDLVAFLVEATATPYVFEQQDHIQTYSASQSRPSRSERPTFAITQRANPVQTKISEKASSVRLSKLEKSGRTALGRWSRLRWDPKFR